MLFYIYFAFYTYTIYILFFKKIPKNIQGHKYLFIMCLHLNKILNYLFLIPPPRYFSDLYWSMV